MKKLTEIQALTMVDEALSGLDEKDVQARIVRWAIDKFGISPGGNGTQQGVVLPSINGKVTPERQRMPNPSGSEIPGIAKLVGEELKITARDIKATSTNDAAVRLALITIRANEMLTGSEETSSRKVLVPVLKSWRAYTGNTRPVLANHKGILRNGDGLSLDEHAKREADAYMTQCLDDEITGSWQPAGRRQSAPKAAKKKTAKAGL